MPVLDTILTDRSVNFRLYQRASNCTDSSGEISLDGGFGNVDLGGSCTVIQNVSFRFPLDVPRFSTINASWVRMQKNFGDTATSNGVVVLSMSDSANAPAVTSKTDFTSTTNKVGSTNYTPGQWLSRTYYFTSNFGSQLQQIVNKEGWNSGNFVNVYILCPNITSLFWSVESGDDRPDDAPMLRVNYTEADNFKHLDLVGGQLREVAGLSGHYLTLENDGSYKRRSGLEASGALILDNGIIKEKA